MRLSCWVLELFQNVEESERGGGCGGCWLVLCWIGRYPGRGHWRRCFLLRKTIGYICIFCWGGNGMHGMEQLWVLLCLGLGPRPPLKSLFFGAILLMLCYLLLRGNSPRLWVNLQECLSTGIYYCCGVLEQIIGCSKFQVLWKVESPRETLVVISAYTGRAGIWSIGVHWLCVCYQVEVNSFLAYYKDKE